MTATPIIDAVRTAGYPGYDKIKHSFVVHSDRTGITLRPEAMAAVAKLYPAFAAALPGAPKPRRTENRKKANHIRARLNDTDYATVLRWMAEDGIKTQQDFIEACILAYAAMHGKSFINI